MNSNCDIKAITLLAMPLSDGFNTSTKSIHTRDHGWLHDVPAYWKISFLCATLLVAFFILQGWVNKTSTEPRKNIFQFQQLISTARQLHLQTQIGEAHQLYQKALPLASSSLDSSYTLNQLGATFGAQHNHQAALSSYRMAASKLDIQDSKKNMRFWQEKARNTAGLGDAYLAMDEPDSALLYYEQALEIYLNHLNDSSASIQNEWANIWHSTGHAFVQMQWWDSAHQAYENALNKWKSIQAGVIEEQTNIARAQSSLGFVYASQYNFEAAEQMLRNAYKTFRRLSQDGEENFQPQIAESLVNLGMLYTGFEMYEAALASFEEAGQIYQELIHTEPSVYLVPIARVFIQKAGCLTALMHYREAEGAYNKAMDFLLRHKAPNAQLKKALLTHLISLYQTMQNQQLPVDYEQKVRPLLSIMDTLQYPTPNQQVIKTHSTEQDSTVSPVN